MYFSLDIFWFDQACKWKILQGVIFITYDECKREVETLLKNYYFNDYASYETKHLRSKIDGRERGLIVKRISDNSTRKFLFLENGATILMNTVRPIKFTEEEIRQQSFIELQESVRIDHSWSAVTNDKYKIL